MIQFDEHILQMGGKKPPTSIPFMSSTVSISSHTSIEAVPKLLQIMFCGGCASPCVPCGLPRRRGSGSLGGKLESLAGLEVMTIMIFFL